MRITSVLASGSVKAQHNHIVYPIREIETIENGRHLLFIAGCGGRHGALDYCCYRSEALGIISREII